jgi:hypothetical protein
VCAVKFNPTTREHSSTSHKRKTCSYACVSLEDADLTVKILVFTEGTILTHKKWIGVPREEIVKQVKKWSNLSKKELEQLQKTGDAPSPEYFAASVPIGNSVEKIEAWKKQGAIIMYLTSRRKPDEVNIIRDVLKKHSFPEGKLLFRIEGENYKDVAERVMPDIIVEDDCESIGGEDEMTYPGIRPELKFKMKSIVVKEFGGIDHLPDNLAELVRYNN